jgi:hypothetical protein
LENIAKSLACPNDYWTLLLQSALIGKAREIYNSLDLEKRSNYEEVEKLFQKQMNWYREVIGKSLEVVKKG